MPLLAQLVLEPLLSLAPLAVLFQALLSMSEAVLPQDAAAVAGVERASGTAMATAARAGTTAAIRRFTLNPHECDLCRHCFPGPSDET
ncbi:hypothetical protein GCM10010234_48260 [Streptomyces hawaiiensis]